MLESTELHTASDNWVYKFSSRMPCAAPANTVCPRCGGRYGSVPAARHGRHRCLPRHAFREPFRSWALCPWCTTILYVSGLRYRIHSAAATQTQLYKDSIVVDKELFPETGTNASPHGRRQGACLSR